MLSVFVIVHLFLVLFRDFSEMRLLIKLFTFNTKHYRLNNGNVFKDENKLNGLIGKSIGHFYGGIAYNERNDADRINIQP